MLKHIATNFSGDMNHKDAIPYWKEALEMDSEDREVLESLVSALMEQEKFAEALPYARRLYETENGNDIYFYNYVTVLAILKNDEKLLPLLENPHVQKDPYYRRMLADRYLDKARTSRENNPDATLRLMASARELEKDNPLLIYLEGYFAHKDGKKAKAGKAFARLLSMMKGHEEQFEFGMMFHQDGHTKYGQDFFTLIASCTCEMSDILLVEAIYFLAKRDDRDSTLELCDAALKEKKYDLYSVADILFETGKALWAKPYTQKLVEKKNTPEEDLFFHLIVLNTIGDTRETLSFAESVIERIQFSGNLSNIEFWTDAVKQLRKKGRVRIDYE